jgi:hypothetical protein
MTICFAACMRGKKLNFCVHEANSILKTHRIISTETVKKESPVIMFKFTIFDNHYRQFGNNITQVTHA